MEKQLAWSNDFSRVEEIDAEMEAVNEFLALMDKYSVSEEDIERIQIVAKFC